MIRITAPLALLCLLAACSEPPKRQIVFTHDDTCKIIINDLQYEQANNTERPCTQEKSGAAVTAVTVNFLSETCNAYRYSFTGAREGSEGEFVFKAEDNVPNPKCNFIPQYAKTDVEWVLNPK
jgi:hypothetical protein